MTSRKFRAAAAAIALLASLTVTTAASAATPEPLAHWTFDEGQGTVAHDTSGNGHDGTLVGANAGWAPGEVGPYSLSVTPQSYVDEPNIVDTTKSFSVSAWVKLNSLAGYQTFVS